MIRPLDSTKIKILEASYVVKIPRLQGLYHDVLLSKKSKQTAEKFLFAT